MVPMLAKRMNIDRINRCMASRPFAVEPKMDGERMLCHKKGGVLRLFSRNGTDYTPHYGDALQPYFMKSFCAEECILDGEMMGWDSDDMAFVPFGSNKTVAYEQIDAMKAGGNASSRLTRWMCYVAFDILYVNGGAAVAEAVKKSHVSGPSLGPLMGLPLTSRRYILKRLVKEDPHKFEVCPTPACASSTHTSPLSHTIHQRYQSADGEEGQLYHRELTTALSLLCCSVLFLPRLFRPDLCATGR